MQATLAPRVARLVGEVWCESVATHWLSELWKGLGEAPHATICVGGAFGNSVAAGGQCCQLAWSQECRVGAPW